MLRQDGTTYTFSQIFDLNSETDKILADLGYRYRENPLSLPYRTPCSAPQLDLMRTQMRERLPYVPLTSQAARRALYVSPLLFAALDQARFTMHIDCPVTAARLRGTVDYLLQGAHEVIVAAARDTDMTRGFTQLAAQMVALSERRPQQLSPIHPRRARKALRAGRARRQPNETQFSAAAQTQRRGPSGAQIQRRTSSDAQIQRRASSGAQIQLFGAVTTGPVWRFGLLDRTQKTITKDTEAYLLPRDLESLLGIFVELLDEYESKKEREGATPS